MKRLLFAMLAAVVLVTGLVPPPSASAAEPQWRAFWVDTLNRGVFTPAQVAEVVSEAQDAHANVLIVQVVRRFECYCNKSDYVRSTDPNLQSGFDPLAEFVRLGHAAGLEVHAWVNVHTFWNSSTPPTDPRHPFNTNGPTATGDDNWTNVRDDGTGSRYLDVANPAAQDYTAAMIGSIVANYNVDGINLDFIRYPDHSLSRGSPWGYSGTSLRRFREATGQTARPAPNDARFSQFRRDQVTAVVRKIQTAIDGIAPHSVLSINGIAHGYGPSATRSWESTDPYASVFQDWRAWAREGLIDAVVLMNYKNEANTSHAAMFASWNQFLVSVANETGKTMVSGTGLYLNTRENSLKQANTVTSMGLGWAGYAFANVSTVATASTQLSVKRAERSTLLAALAAGPFRDEVGPPLMPWKPGYEGDLYTTPGHHVVNGRQWHTSCAPYSQTRRCYTEIMATIVTFANGRYVQKNQWTFNNLTYLPLLTRNEWRGNPLGVTGAWTAEDGRQWRTECDTALTGRGGCRSHVVARGMVQAEKQANGTFRYYRDDVWVFNNMVRFAPE